MMCNASKNKRAFTLIELLVVIAIIGLLASVVLASLNSAREKGRDARRLADLNQIRIAVEMYYDDHGHYPIAAGWTSFDSPTYRNRAITNPNAPNIASALSPYLPSGAGDPKSLGGDSGYLYRSLSNTSGTEYCILIYRTPENMNNFPEHVHAMNRCGTLQNNGICTVNNAIYYGTGPFANGC